MKLQCATWHTSGAVQMCRAAHCDWRAARRRDFATFLGAVDGLGSALGAEYLGYWVEDGDGPAARRVSLRRLFGILVGGAAEAFGAEPVGAAGGPGAEDGVVRGEADAVAAGRVDVQ